MGSKTTSNDVENVKDSEKSDVVDNEVKDKDKSDEEINTNDKEKEKVDKEDKIEQEKTKGTKDENKKEKKSKKKDDKKIKELEMKLEEADKKKDEYLHMLQLKVAEFENYRKRTIKEKDEIYNRAFSEALSVILPLIDNFDRAVEAMSKEDSSKESIREGVDMIYKQLLDVLKNSGVEEIKTVGKNFDPEYHNAMMHIEDEQYEDNVIVEEFQKGYTYKGKVIRHSAVKVAN